MTSAVGARRLFTARWVLPMDAPPIENGGIVIEGSRVSAVLDAQQAAERVRAAAPGEEHRHFGKAIIMPGLINMHTHLDWTACELVDTACQSLFAWIPSLIGAARQWSLEDFLNSALAGVKRIAGSGTTCVFDSSYSGQAAVALSAHGLRGVVGMELFGVAAEKVEDNWQTWLQRREQLLSNARIAENICLTVAPHAPYSVCPQLMRKAADWAENNGFPFTVHLSETRQEVAWLGSGDAELDRHIEKTHYLTDGKVTSLPFRACGKTPTAYLESEKLLRQGLVVAHCVHMLDDDMKILARQAVGVAHCARSNARLRCGVAPVRQMLEAGVQLGFGTDSAASTDDLDVLSEARFAWNLHRAVDPGFPFDAERALRMLTLDAAKTIGMSHLIGSLTVGKQADIAIFNIASDGPFAEKRPYDALLYGKVNLEELLVDGQKITADGLY